MPRSFRRSAWAAALVGLALALGAMACSILPTGSDSGITLVNRSNDSVCYVQISPVTETTWGDDWLGSTETIDPGDSRHFDVDPGEWDMRALNCDQATIDEERRITVPDTGYEWIVE